MTLGETLVKYGIDYKNMDLPPERVRLIERYLQIDIDACKPTAIFWFPELKAKLDP